MKIRFDKSGGWLNKIGLFDWVDFDGVVKLDVQPILDPKNNRIYASDLALDLESSNKLADTLVELMQLTVVKDQLKQIFRYDFLPDMQRGKNEAYTALNTQIAQDVAIKGNIHSISANQIEIADGGLMLVTKAEGELSVHIGDSKQH